MSDDTQRYKNLRQAIVQVNSKIERHRGQREEQERLLKGLLQRHGCETLEEMELKREALKSEADAAYAEGAAAVEKAAKAIAEAEAALMDTGA